MSCNVIYRYQVPCPFCGHYQFLEFEQVRWPKNCCDPEEVRELAWYECESCGNAISEAQKATMLIRGKWTIFNEKSQKRRKIGFHLSALYSPFVTWGELAAEFLEAKDDPALLMDFINSRLAEPWKEVVERRREDDVLSLKGSLDPGVVPKDAVALTAGVDTQHDGFYYVVHAWTNDFRTWLIRYGFAHNWEELAQVIWGSLYRLEASDLAIPIARVFIDSGGDRTGEVYDWVRRNGQGICYPIKGMSFKSGVPLKESVIDKFPGSNKPIPGGLRLVHIDTDHYKDRINQMLKAPSKWQLHKMTGIDYAIQMVAEEKRRVKKGGRYVEEWVRLHRQNHYLDATVYAFAAADHLQVQFLRPIAAEWSFQETKTRPDHPSQRGYESSLSWIPRRPKWLSLP